MPITLSRYSPAKSEALTVPNVQAALPLQAANEISWLDIDHHHHRTDIEEIAKALGLHPVVAKNLKRANQRPHVEYYDEYTVIVTKMLRRAEGAVFYRIEPVIIVMGEGYIATIQGGKTGDVFGNIRDELNISASKLRTLGVDYLMYRLLDAIVEEYFEVLEKLDEQVEVLEHNILEKGDPTTAKQLYRLKREVVTVRKAVWPMREVVSSLERNAMPIISKETQVYLRDAYEQIVQAIDGIESLRDLMSSMVEIYLSSVNNRMNSVIKVLTIITTIFMPLTLITGIYGMNIDALPGLHDAATPWILMGSLVVIIVSMLSVFRYKRWL